ncbi:MAG: hypothetical protein V2J55_10055, partial [Candidatus Competibacteraceae bacterium]|nr:hypothetical protein [Candidatus Competibacteraceae bacterium]
IQKMCIFCSGSFKNGISWNKGFSRKITEFYSRLNSTMAGSWLMVFSVIGLRSTPAGEGGTAG